MSCKKLVWAAICIAISLSTLGAQDLPKAITLAEMNALVDWLQFPIPSTAKSFHISTKGIEFTAKVAQQEYLAKYREILLLQGWERYQPDKSQAIAEVEIYTRNNCKVQLKESYDDRTKLVQLNVAHYGNIDASLILKPAGYRKTDLKVFWPLVKYETDLSLMEATRFVREQMEKLGWREVFRENTLKMNGNLHEARDLIGKKAIVELYFVQNACELQWQLRASHRKGIEVTCTSELRDRVEASQVAEMLKSQGHLKASTFEEYVKVIDLRKFPLMPKAIPCGGGDRFEIATQSIEYELPDQNDSSIVKEFHHPLLVRNGWVCLNCASGDSMLFTKKGYTLQVRVGTRTFLPKVSLGSADKELEKRAQLIVSLDLLGVVDLRCIPHPRNAQIHYEPANKDSVHYMLDARPEQVLTFYHQQLSRQGWKQIQNPTNIINHGGVFYNKNAEIIEISVKPYAGITSVALVKRLLGSK